MKVRAVVVLGCLIGAVVLCMGAEFHQAEPEADKVSLKIGVVNIQRIFLTCKGNAKYEGEAKAEKNKLDAELEKLGAEIKAEQAGLRTLKPGSSDHIAQVEEILTKQAGLRTKEELYKRRLELKYQLFIEGLYKDILRETSEVAKQKGLYLVQVKDEVEFPAPSLNDAMMAIRTHKLLYSGGCLDITDEVMARLDAAIDN